MAQVNPTYQINCPKCGAALSVVALDVDTAPWLCSPCGLGFWASELSHEARAIYDVKLMGRGSGRLAQSINEQVDFEKIAALANGTSLRSDQMSLAHDDVLASIKHNNNVHATFLAVVETEIKNRGVTQ